MKRSYFTTFQLKLIALCLMLIDHIGAFFPSSPQWFRYVGRISAPLFLFCLVWGMDYTRNRKKYVLRLYCTSVLMEIMWFILYQFTELEVPSQGYNIFVMLTNAAILINLLYPKMEQCKYNRKNAWMAIIAWQTISTILCFGISYFPYSVVTRRMIIAVTGNIFLCEGGLYFSVLALALYMWKNNRKKTMIGYTVFCVYDKLISATAIFARLTYFVDFHTENLGSVFAIICYLVTGQEYWNTPLVLHSFYWGDYQWMMIGALPFMLLYNQKPGKKVKWFFYFFYPIHLLLLLVIKKY